MLDDYKAQLQKLEHGKTRIGFLKTCIKEALSEGEFPLVFSMYFDLIEESKFCDNGYDCVITFPEYMQKLDTYEKEISHVDPRHYLLFMHGFKHYLGEAKKYYQIVKKTEEQLMDEYKARCKRYGFSLRTYYAMKMEQCRELEYYEQFLKLFKKEKRDKLSGDPDVELYMEFSIELNFDRVDNALELLKLADDEELIGTMYHHLAHYYEQCRRYDLCKPYAEKALECDKSGEYKANEGSLIELCANSDINLGLDAFSSLIMRVFESSTPKNKFDAFRASTRLFRKFIKRRRKSVEIPALGEKFPLFEASGNYDTQQMFDFFYKQSMELAEKFDKSEGGQSYTQSVQSLIIL